MNRKLTVISFIIYTIPYVLNSFSRVYINIMQLFISCLLLGFVICSSEKKCHPVYCLLFSFFYVIYILTAAQFTDNTYLIFYRSISIVYLNCLIISLEIIYGCNQSKLLLFVSSLLEIFHK